MRLKQILIRVTLALTTPLLEKNPVKASGLITGRKLPFVFSMSRLIVLAFAAVMLRQAWKAGIIGWPEATLSIAIVLALPILGALERVPASETVALAKALVARFGIGSTRQIKAPFASEPSKFDDHRHDDVAAPSASKAATVQAASPRRKAA